MHKILSKISLRARYLGMAVPRYLRTGEKQPQIIFIHVPKAAGSSINRYIRHSVGPLIGNNHANLNEVHFTNDGQKRDRQILAARRVRYVYGHMAWETMEAVRQGREAYVFTMLRAPAARLRSEYFYAKNLPMKRLQVAIADGQLAAQIAEMSPLEFFTCQHPRLRLGLDNFMVRQLCGDFSMSPQTDDDWRDLLEKAKNHLHQLDYVGFQERFDDDFGEITLGAGLPQVKRATRVNTTKSLLSETASSSPIPAEFDDEVKNAIVPLIRWDLELYDFARETFTA